MMDRSMSSSNEDDKEESDWSDGSSSFGLIEAEGLEDNSINADTLTSAPVIVELPPPQRNYPDERPPATKYPSNKDNEMAPEDENYHGVTTLIVVGNEEMADQSSFGGSKISAFDEKSEDMDDQTSAGSSSSSYYHVSRSDVMSIGSSCDSTTFEKISPSSSWKVVVQENVHLRQELQSYQAQLHALQTRVQQLLTDHMADLGAAAAAPMAPLRMPEEQQYVDDWILQERWTYFMSRPPSLAPISPSTKSLPQDLPRMADKDDCDDDDYYYEANDDDDDDDDTVYKDDYTLYAASLARAGKSSPSQATSFKDEDEDEDSDDDDDSINHDDDYYEANDDDDDDDDDTIYKDDYTLYAASLVRAGKSPPSQATSFNDEDEDTDDDDDDDSINHDDDYYEANDDDDDDDDDDTIYKDDYTLYAASLVRAGKSPPSQATSFDDEDEDTDDDDDDDSINHDDDYYEANDHDDDDDDTIYKDDYTLYAASLAQAGKSPPSQATCFYDEDEDNIEANDDDASLYKDDYSLCALRSLTSCNTRSRSGIVVPWEIDFSGYILEDESDINALMDTTLVKAKQIVDPYGEKGIYSGVLSKSTGMPHGIGRLEYEKVGRWYAGDWIHGRWNGHGYMSNDDGDVYEGGFKNERKHGAGIMKFADGRIFEGVYIRGQMNQGKMTYPDGSVYEGYWADGMRHGRGKCTFLDGCKYVGEFQEGNFHGHGQMTWNDGGWYLGEWYEGEMHGKGKEFRPDGTLRHEGDWSRGRPIRSGRVAAH